MNQLALAPTQPISEDDMVALSHPVNYGTTCLNMSYYRWQERVLEAMDPEGSEALLITHNESGKTSIVLVTLILWHMEVFPNSLIVTTSASQLQIQQQLYPSLVAKTAKWPGWKISQGKPCRVVAPNGSRCISYATNDAKFAEGFHGVEDLWKPTYEEVPDDWGWSKKEFEEYRSLSKVTKLMMCVDEGKGVKKGIYDAYDRCNPDRLFICSSPDHDSPSGPFYDLAHSERDRFRQPDGSYNIFHSSYLQCPHQKDHPRKLQHIEKLIASRGRNDAFVRSFAFGEFPLAGKNLVFNLIKVDYAFSGMVNYDDLGETQLYAAIDLSGGRDAQVVTLRMGNKAWVDKTYHEPDATILADNLILDFKRLGLTSSNIRIDNGNQGDAIIDILVRKGFSHIQRIDFGAEPIDKKRYLNVRSEMYFEFAARIMRGEVILNRHQGLQKQFAWIEYGSDARMGTRLKIKDKDDMPHSPDELDTMVMLFYKVKSVQHHSGDVAAHNRRLSPTYIPPDETIQGQLY